MNPNTGFELSEDKHTGTNQYTKNPSGSSAAAESEELTQQEQEYLQTHETRKRYNNCSNETQKRLNSSSDSSKTIWLELF
jgi:hypothetical protein